MSINLLHTQDIFEKFKMEHKVGISLDTSTKSFENLHQINSDF